MTQLRVQKYHRKAQQKATPLPTGSAVKHAVAALLLTNQVQKQNKVRQKLTQQATHTPMHPVG
tara:strand:- start:12 stop:200 length:189 start_codon:yes stop_codon:yes gene_type:complete